MIKNNNESLQIDIGLGAKNEVFFLYNNDPYNNYFLSL